MLHRILRLGNPSNGEALPAPQLAASVVDQYRIPGTSVIAEVHFQQRTMAPVWELAIRFNDPRISANTEVFHNLGIQIEGDGKTIKQKAAFLCNALAQAAGLIVPAPTPAIEQTKRVEPAISDLENDPWAELDDMQPGGDNG